MAPMSYEPGLTPLGVPRHRSSARLRAKDESVNGIGVASWAAARSALLVAATLLVMALGPTVLGCRSLVVVSGSMSPHVLVGDILVTRPLGDRLPKRGQILVVDDPAHPGRLVSHRLVRINADGTLRLRGDANQKADSTPVPRQAVRGVAVLRVPLIGWPAVWAQQAASLPLSLTALLTLVVGLLGFRRLPARLTAPSERPAHRARGRRVAAGRSRDGDVMVVARASPSAVSSVGPAK
jgi:signal peptidase I